MCMYLYIYVYLSYPKPILTEDLLGRNEITPDDLRDQYIKNDEHPLKNVTWNFSQFFLCQSHPFFTCFKQVNRDARPSVVNFTLNKQQAYLTSAYMKLVCSPKLQSSIKTTTADGQIPGREWKTFLRCSSVLNFWLPVPGTEMTFGIGLTRADVQGMKMNANDVKIDSSGWKKIHGFNFKPSLPLLPYRRFLTDKHILFLSCRHMLK